VLEPVSVSEAEALYRRYRQPVRAYLVRLTGRPDWADDLLQETFFRALRSIGSFRGEATPLTWLCSIARNAAASHARRQKRDSDLCQPGTALALPAATAAPEQVILSREQRREIARILSTMPEQQRLALLLRDLDGLPYETIAGVLGLTMTNVKVTIHRARLRFRAGFRQERSDGHD
jgi:RNA polymerase sigma-70 factor (ECF subfamily)